MDKGIYPIRFQLWCTMTIACALVAVLVWSPTAQANTRAEYIAKAEPICRKTNRSIDRSSRAVNDLRGTTQFRRAGAIVLDASGTLSRGIGQLREITPPAGDEGQLDAWLSTLGREARLIKRAGRALEVTSTDKAITLLRHARLVVHRAHHEVAGFGFTACVGKSS